MARIIEPAAKEKKAWTAWVASRPNNVRKVVERFDPWSLYRMKSTGHRVTIHSFSEDGTLTVNITGEFNTILFDRQVFGINPDDLEPCDLPDADEITGTVMTQEQVDENIDNLRVAIRPDLWTLGPDGKAVRKKN